MIETSITDYWNNEKVLNMIKATRKMTLSIRTRVLQFLGSIIKEEDWANRILTEQTKDIKKKNTVNILHEIM